MTGHVRDKCQIQVFFFLIFFNLFVFLGLNPHHIDVSTLAAKSEPHPPAHLTATATADPSHICNLHHSQIFNPLNEARDGTRILVDTSRVQ